MPLKCLLGTCRHRLPRPGGPSTAEAPTNLAPGVADTCGKRVVLGWSGTQLQSPRVSWIAAAVDPAPGAQTGRRMQL